MESITVNDEPIAKFSQRLKVKDDIVLTLGVSMDKDQFLGNDLDLFIAMIKRHANIKKLKVLIGAYLHRHYVGEPAATKKHEDYISKTKQQFDKLGIPYEFVDWKDVISTNEFAEAQKFINELYNIDSEFKILVDNVAKSHSHRGNNEASKAYLLEECGYFKLTKGYWTYPAVNLNAACEYIIRKFNPDFYYKPYSLVHKPTTGEKSNDIISTTNSNTDIKQYTPQKSKKFSYVNDTNMNAGNNDPQILITECGHLAQLMNKFGLNTPQQQEKFFSQYLHTTHQLSQLIPAFSGTTYENTPPNPSTSLNANH
jgi:hypothetical protein